MRKKHMKKAVSSRNTIKVDNSYKFEDVPVSISCDQFYCYNKRNGKIYIGTIIGASAIYSYEVYLSIDGVTHKTSTKFALNENKTITLNRQFECFLIYQDFVRAYSEYADKKKKEKSLRTTKYLVDKRTFHCRKTTAPYRSGIEVQFATQKEAEEYSLNGLKKLQKEVPVILRKYEEIKERIRSIKRLLVLKYGEDIIERSQRTFLSSLQPNINDLKPDDTLFKVEYKQYKHNGIEKINDEYSVTVKGFVKPGLAKLSDGTILVGSEINRSYPLFFLESQRALIERIIKYIALNRLESSLKYDVQDAERAVKYASKYVPFSRQPNVYFDKAYKKESIKGIEEILDTEFKTL